MKKLYALVLSLLLFLGLTYALAEEIPAMHTSGDWKYILLEDGTAEITRYSGSAGWVHIPNEIDGYSVKSIGEKAFLWCDSLKRVTIPDGVTNIGGGAFSYCKSLWNIEIPDSVTSIGANPFQSCSSLTDIVFAPDHPVLATIDGVLFNKVEKKLIFYPCKYTDNSYAIPQGIRIIGEFAFSHCMSLTSIIIPDGVISIGEGAFFHCQSLDSLIIPYGVISIEKNLFSDCNNLTSVTIPDSVTSIGAYAFNNCYDLMNVSIPANVSSIGDNAFASCFSLASITIPEGVTRIEDYTFFRCSGLTSVILPDSLTSIGNYSFFYCDELKSIILPKGVTDINGLSFLIQQTEIIISPDNPVLEILDGVLYNTEEKKLLCYTCSFISTSYTIPQGTLAINDNAFANCSSLSSITIPDSVTSIGTGAFSSCNSLKTITVPRDSYTEQWCKENNLRYTYPDANDWLLN